MADNILDSITEQYHSLTKSGKKLADYVFSHTAETQYLSITSVSYTHLDVYKRQVFGAALEISFQYSAIAYSGRWK